ncbi:cellulose synthase A catalytic subunit 4 [UDP-forming]-like [Cornus florida]|uniref:cellulose synthase A catalytic subunit 4 [UDP-forming]-like n=1 Tax=Cornus florida TaxID=4283 RepID=UPI00289EEC6F|nr:cellulose synthase A catalytic subunit 4 [UDP-forming]-like [Cornus florida]
MESLPLHHCTVQKLSAIINRSHVFLHCMVLIAMIYYRASSFLYPENTQTLPFLPWLLVFSSELILSFIWLLKQGFFWQPVTRTVFPERLPGDEELPAVDVFICTADPKKEPPVGVMNTVLSAMALDYPPDKLSVYLSDDGGASVTLYAMREAWGFARLWLPFCRRYGTKTRCPEAYFSSVLDDDNHGGDTEFTKHRDNIERKYEEFKERVSLAGQNVANNAQSHPPSIEVIGRNNVKAVESDQAEMPLLVYISREKKPSHPHHFKAGALNVLLRVSGIISNAPYILILDCDMYSNDPKSARQAMCFHLDPKLSPSLAFVQFPQKFHNVSQNDIYDGELKSTFMIMWQGTDGLSGPLISGTCFYIKRKALYGSNIHNGVDIPQLRQSLGPSNEFMGTLGKSYKRINIDDEDLSNKLLQHAQFLASCAYEKQTKWGQQIGFLYNSVVEDYFTGFMLHCKGWTSVYCDPSRPAFLGSATTNLNDTLVQGTRWMAGLLEVAFSTFCPLIYGLSRMSILETMCYGYLAFIPLYCIPLWCLATIPQLCLLNGIPVYPEVSSSWFIIFSLIFFSSHLKLFWDFYSIGDGSIQRCLNEWRIWMIKSVTAYLYGSLDAIFELIGMREASFIATNKVTSDEEVKLYQMGIFDFRTSTMFLVPMVSLVILNMVSFTGGIARATFEGGWNQNFAQVFLSLFILIVNYPIIEGMIWRKDKGGIPLSITLLSVTFALIFLFFGTIALMYVR